MMVYIAKSYGLTIAKNEKVPAIKIMTVEAVGLSVSNYTLRFCEYVNFGEIPRKIDILPTTAQLRFESQNPFAHM